MKTQIVPLAVLLILTGMMIPTTTAETATGSTVDVTIIGVDGTEYTTSVTVMENYTGYNVTIDAASALQISINSTYYESFSSHSIDDLFGEISDVAWGESGYWSWGLFVKNGSGWEASSVGVDSIAIDDNQSIAWAPMIDYGVWSDIPLNDALECMAADHTIGLDSTGLAFNLTSLSIAVGDSVCWTWEDASMPHNVAEVQQEGYTSYNGGVRSGDAVSSLAFTHTFEENATFNYVCEPHASMGMAGQIVVGDGGVVVAEETEVVEETPGFTTVTMAIALLAAVLLARRKD